MDLFTFFITSSKATKVGANLKKKIEGDFKEGINTFHLFDIPIKHIFFFDLTLLMLFCTLFYLM